MAERKKSPIEKDLGQKKSQCKKTDEVKNRATEAKKNPPIPKWIIGWTKKKASIEKEKDHEVKNRMHEGKKVQYRKDEVKNRADGRTKKDAKRKKSTSL